MSHAIFYFLLFPLFDLCSTSRYFHYFCLLSSILILHPMIFPNTLHLPSSVHTSICHLLTSVFCIPLLCSFVPFLSLSSHHLSIILCLPFPTLTTQHFIPCDSVSHLLHSPYYTICHTTPSLVV